MSHMGQPCRNPGWTDTAVGKRKGLQEQVTETAKKRGDTRRRIKDILQASELEQQAFGEVWDR